MLVPLYSCTTWILMKQLEHKLDKNYTKDAACSFENILGAAPNKTAATRLLTSHLASNSIYIQTIMIIIMNRNNFVFLFRFPPWRYNYTSYQFLTSTLADVFIGIWVTASLLKSPGLISVFCILYSLDSLIDFQLFQTSFQSFVDCSKCANYNWYYRYSHVLQRF